MSLPFICLAGRPLDGDIWWVLANGRVLAQHAALPTADPLTFAPHSPIYFDAQWLAQLAYYAAYQALGLAGVSVFNGLAGAATFGILLQLAWRRSQSAPAAFAASAVGTLTALPFLHPRAEALGLLAFAATMWLVVDGRRSRARLVALSVVTATWVNLHGSFFLGPLLTVVVAAGEVADLARDGRWRAVRHSPRLRFLAAALAAQAVGSLANPYGVYIYEYALRLSADSFMRNYITEWFPTAARSWSEVQFFLSVALVGGVLALTRQRVRTPDLLLLGLFVALGLEANRNIVFWGVASVPMLAPYLAALALPQRLLNLAWACLPKREQVRGNLLRAGVVGLLVVLSLPWVKATNTLLAPAQRSLISERYPLAAVEFLRTHDYASHVFAEQTWGSYLDWALWPRYQPMVDPAIEVHPRQVWLDVIALAQGNVFWQELLDKYGADVLLLSRDEQAPLIEAVEGSPRWERVYSDEQAVIYVPASLGVPAR